MSSRSMLLEKEDELLKEGYTIDQIREIQEGIEHSVDVSVFLHKEYMPIQMRQIRIGLEENLSVDLYANYQYDWFQMDEIRKGLEKGLDVKKYALVGVPYEKMREVRKGLEDGFDLSRYLAHSAKEMREIRKALEANVDIAPYLDGSYDAYQLAVIREALEKNIDIMSYVDKNMRGTSMREIMLGLQDKLDVKLYAKIEYSWQQMREIRLGLKNRIDVGVYNNIYYNWKQMKEIRLGLEAGVNVYDYARLMYTAKEMSKYRRRLISNGRGYAKYDVTHLEDIDIKMSSDEMEVQIRLLQKDKIYDRHDIMLELAEYGIVEGIDEHVINRLVTDNIKEVYVTVAKGKLPTEGKNGWNEFLFDITNKRKPKVLPDGSVDFRNTEWYQTVKKGQVIAIYHPATKGEPGKTVTNKKIEAKKGKELSILELEGVELADDHKSYIASVGGMVEYKKGKLIVTDTMEIEEVTLATGDIDFEGNVYVKGNVTSGTTLKARGDIIICGCVEAATVISEGDIEVHLGMNGSEKGHIEAKGNLSGKYFENATLKAGKNIFTNNMLNCKAYALGKVIINGRGGHITNGETYARLGIDSYNIGNMSRTRTFIKVGVNEEMLEQIQFLTKQIRDIKKELEILKYTYTECNKKFSVEQRNSMVLYLKLEKSLEIYNKRLDKTTKEKERLEKDLNNAHKSKVIVKGNIYEGVVIEIDNNQWNAYDVRNVVIDKEHSFVRVNKK